MPRVKIDSIYLQYEISGYGPPVVFINGLTMDLNGWLLQVEPFSRKYRILRYDCRGQGGSDKPDTEYSQEMHAEDLRGLMEKLEIPRAHIIGLSNGGHSVKLGSRQPQGKTAPAKNVSVGTQADAVKFGEAVILAIPFSAVKETVDAIGPNAFKGKTLIDATNVFPQPPGWGASTSGAEETAKLVPGAKVVKAFNTAFANTMSTGKVGSSKLLGLVAADDAAARKTVLRLAADIGFDPVDAGPLNSAR